jgi:uroporphyrinogen decarboxylase
MKQNKESQGFLEKERDGHIEKRTDRPLLWRVLDGEVVKPPPLWLMRQAGRYLPEYRAMRARVSSFLDLCLEPALATEITLQPVQRFDFDAAILFSDILIVPYALGRRVSFVEGEGPVLDPIDEKGIAALGDCGSADVLQAVFETVTRAREKLDRGKSLIGFCGGPWTVATYMVAGRGTSDQAPARMLAARAPELFQDLIDKITSASVAYLIGQIEAGVDVVQIFDSWAGILDEEGFARWCVAPTRRIVSEVREAAPHVRLIGFPKGAGLRFQRYVAETGVDGIAVDWTTPLAMARDELQPVVAVQGNLDPILLVAGSPRLDAQIEQILEALSDGRFVFNLGHGILPETPVENVVRLVKRVRAWR